MRSLYADAEYFSFLDSLDGALTEDIFLIAGQLTLEFPGLRTEEAKAICTDWRASRKR